jgi:demethylmenaquinone methyltransferase/2-methoxy-6-polyprenyl-1,4-benzoquinol methylase
MNPSREHPVDDPAAPPSEGTAHFGFRSVPTGDKAGLVRDVFDSVAGRYDLMNDLMSLGVHRAWKRAMLDWLRPRPQMRLLDVGGGTGDIAFGFIDRGGRRAMVVDVNREMLTYGRDRGIDRGLTGEIDWIAGNGECLPIADDSVDAYTTAFCIRNVTHIDRMLQEACRVLRPGGRFLCLEFSRVAVPALGEIYDAYSFRLLPLLGHVVTGNADAYRYLVESIRRFPSQQRFAGMIADAGFDRVRYRNLSGGIVAIHSAWRT